MRFFFGQIIVALGVGVIVALIRYYTTMVALRYIKNVFRIKRRQKEAGNG